MDIKTSINDLELLWVTFSWYSVCVGAVLGFEIVLTIKKKMILVLFSSMCIAVCAQLSVLISYVHTHAHSREGTVCYKKQTRKTQHD